MGADVLVFQHERMRVSGVTPVLCSSTERKNQLHSTRNITSFSFHPNVRGWRELVRRSQWLLHQRICSKRLPL